jgi:phytoene dehydrogenase-like protein
VVVIGAGTNGLTAAQILATSGRQVIVLDQKQPADVDFDAGWVPPSVRAALNIQPEAEEQGSWLVMPMEGGRFELFADIARSAESIRRLSPRDASRWPEFCTRMRRLAGVLETLYQQNAPDVETTDPGELMHLALLGLRVRGLGRQTVIDLLRILPMPVAELLDEWFESELLKAAVGSTGVMDLCQGPRSAGTAFVMLHHHVGRPAGVFRPLRTSLRSTLSKRTNVEIRHDAAMHLEVAGERIRAVTLESGDTIETDCLVSSADPRRTMLDLLDPGWLDPEFMRAVHNIKMKGVAGTVTLALSCEAPFRQMSLAPSLTHIERAYDDVKYGRPSAQPWLELRNSGQKIEVQVQYLPQVPREGAWDEAGKRSLGNDVARRVVDAAPELKDAITGIRVMTPLDLDAHGGLTGGHRYQGDLTLDQILFMRPVAGWSRYRTPIGGLWLCGSGTHPGGGVAGASGLLAAREILRDAR